MSAPQEVVALEAAEAEFQKWCDAMDLNSKLDTSAMDDDDRKDFDAQKRTVIDAIRFGRLVTNDSGEFVFTPQVGDRSPLTFAEPDGAMLLSIDKAGKANADFMQKSHTLLAAITGDFVQRFAKMKNRDLSVCKAITGFLLAK